VRSILRVLISKVETYTDGVANSLNGLKNMSSEHPEVRSILGVLIKVESCTDRLSGRQLALALEGLKKMSNEHAEVRSIRTALSRIAE
jgi:hypothetical protein